MRVVTIGFGKRVFDPQTKERANQKPRILICDGFGTHKTLEILQFCFENKIVLCRLPSYTSHKLQPYDVAVFAPLKAAYRDQVERLERGGVSTIGKQYFTYLYSPARQRAFNKKNILAGWAKSGMFPINPDRVLADIPKLIVTLAGPKALVLDVRNSPLGEVVQAPEVPVTPATPTTSAALIPLQDLIKQDAHTLDEMSKQRLQRHVQKLINATNISFAERSLQQDQIRFMKTVNNEAKARRSTQSLVLGKAKVMSYEL